MNTPALWKEIEDKFSSIKDSLAEMKTLGVFIYDSMHHEWLFRKKNTTDVFVALKYDKDGNIRTTGRFEYELHQQRRLSRMV